MRRNAWSSAIKAKIELVTRRNVPCFIPDPSSPLPSSPASTSCPGAPLRTAQYKADHRGDQRPQERRNKPVHTKPKANALRDPARQEQHERIDHKREQAELVEALALTR